MTLIMTFRIFSHKVKVPKSKSPKNPAPKFPSSAAPKFPSKPLQFKLDSEAALTRSLLETDKCKTEYFICFLIFLVKNELS